MLAGTYRFVLTLPLLCFLWIWQLYRNNFTFGILTSQKLKNLRAKVKLTVLFKKKKHLTLKRTNTENGSKYTNHKSQTTTFCFLRGSLRCKGEKAKKVLLLLILIDVVEKHKIQRRVWHRRSGVIHKQL